MGRSTDSSGLGAVGIGLAGSPARSTGFCYLRSARRLRAEVLHDDEEILAATESARPALVVIDAPLSLPRGRASIEDRSGPHLRACDRELLRLGIRFFPLTLGPMRMLTVRGMRLERALSRRGYRVLEGYPGGSQDLLGLPRKQVGVPLLQRALLRAGISGVLAKRPLTHDELDAVTIAWVGRRFLDGDGVLVGDPEEGLMLLPTRERPERLVRPPRRAKSTRPNDRSM